MILPQYDSRCGWYEQLDQVSDFPALNGDRQVDLVVIGGGFVGCAAARRMAENRPDAKVLLLEALKIGQGASGRNSGFVIDQPHKRDLESGNEALKQKIVRLNRVAVEYLETQIEHFGIDCQWSHAGKYQAAVGPRGRKHLDHYEQLLQQGGEAYQRLSREEMRSVFGTDFYSAAIHTPGGALMQPAALMRGLADSMPDNVEIAENTAVTSIKRTRDGFELMAGRAHIRCRQLILGTNIFTAELGYMADRILPIMTFASMTAPLTDEQLRRYGGRLDWGITPADHAGTTLRMTQDRRLIVRNSYRYAHDYNTPQALIPQVSARHRKAFDERYPQLSDVAFEYTWGGASGLSGNFETYFGELESNIFASCCDQSVGAARGTISGMMLADMACGRRSDLLCDMQNVSGCPSRLPPKPLLRIGVPMRLAMARFASRSEV
ncbi:NAD(P)/FAD-dependent oxidoreductase [Marinobacterium marinum]|uniref:FAD-binding oxidoreductase n=1 Tax=Marinobacterium marinum TaxID=2756129 RepID=A0A7W1WYL9_9GAMM|nr:FAD-dependent oxidoreductase [Marinobacterium marinum]MBA4502630.1 FAD-binding oxidoreductase [Marinobacterium marinum]